MHFFNFFRAGTEVLEFDVFEAHLQGIEGQDHLNDHRIYFQTSDFGPTTTQDHQYQKHIFRVCYILCIRDMVDFVVALILLWGFIVTWWSRERQRFQSG